MKENHAKYRVAFSSNFLKNEYELSASFFTDCKIQLRSCLLSTEIITLSIYGNTKTKPRVGELNISVLHCRYKIGSPLDDINVHSIYLAGEKNGEIRFAITSSVIELREEEEGEEMEGGDMKISKMRSELSRKGLTAFKKGANMTKVVTTPEPQVVVANLSRRRSDPGRDLPFGGISRQDKSQKKYSGKPQDSPFSGIPFHNETKQTQFSSDQARPFAGIPLHSGDKPPTSHNNSPMLSGSTPKQAIPSRHSKIRGHIRKREKETKAVQSVV
jgi:hypothetical protein